MSTYLKENGKEELLKLPVVTPRYHGEGCVLEVAVLEKHEANCPYRKAPNPERNAQNDKVGEYEVVGRMIFKTCNFSNNNMNQQAAPKTQPYEFSDSSFNKNYFDVSSHGGVSETDEAKEKIIERLKKELVEELTISSKRFCKISDVGVQTAVFGAKEGSKDNVKVIPPTPEGASKETEPPVIIIKSRSLKDKPRNKPAERK